MGNYTHPPLESQSQAQYLSKVQFKILKNYGIFHPPPISQNTPVSVSIISPQSSPDLDTDQGETIEETIKQTVNQMLLTTNTGSLTSNLNLSNISCYRTTDRQSVPTLNPSDIHKYTTTLPNHTYKPDSSENSFTPPPQILVKLNKSSWTQILYHIHPPYVTKFCRN